MLKPREKNFISRQKVPKLKKNFEAENEIPKYAHDGHNLINA